MKQLSHVRCPGTYLTTLEWSGLHVQSTMCVAICATVSHTDVVLHRHWTVATEGAGNSCERRRHELRARARL